MWEVMPEEQLAIIPRLMGDFVSVHPGSLCPPCFTSRCTMKDRIKLASSSNVPPPR